MNTCFLLFLLFINLIKVGVFVIISLLFFVKNLVRCVLIVFLVNQINLIRIIIIGLTNKLVFV